MTKARSLSDFIESDGSVTLVDNQKIKLGTGNDLQIYHNANTSFITESGSSNLKIGGENLYLQNTAHNENYLEAIANGAVTLYYNNVAKLATTSSGINVTGHITASGTNNIYVGDNGKFVAGGGDDLQIYHDGTNSSIQNSTGDLFIYGGEDDIRIRAKNDEESIVANPNGGVYIYHDGSPKLATTSTGISVTGNVALTGDIQKTGQITLDASTDIALDTDSGIILFKDGGTNKGRITTSGDIISIVNSTQNGDIKFDGLNGSSSITALRLDMSEGGRATFNEDVEAQGLYVGSRNASYDFYNNGTTYLNGAVTVDDNITVTGTVDGVDVASIGSTVAGLSTVATSGAYSDLSGLPTIPTNNNQLTNGAGFTTYTSNQSLNTTDGPTFSTVYVSNWFRATGQSGLYFQSYGGGWYMIDSTWIRNYGSKPLYMNNQIACTSNITAYYSDERLKDKQGKIENALDKVSQIETFYFKENELAKELGHSNDKKQVGVSAQSVKKVLPEIVDLAPFDMDTKEDGEIVSMSGEDYMTIDYAKLTPLLIEAIKELKAEIKELKESK